MHHCWHWRAPPGWTAQHHQQGELTNSATHCPPSVTAPTPTNTHTNVTLFVIWHSAPLGKVSREPSFLHQQCVPLLRIQTQCYCTSHCFTPTVGQIRNTGMQAVAVVQLTRPCTSPSLKTMCACVYTNVCECVHTNVCACVHTNVQGKHMGTEFLCLTGKRGTWCLVVWGVNHCHLLTQNHLQSLPCKHISYQHSVNVCTCVCVCVCVCVCGWVGGCGCACVCFSAISINHQPFCFSGKCCEYQQHERSSSDGWVHASVEKGLRSTNCLNKQSNPSTTWLNSRNGNMQTSNVGPWKYMPPKTCMRCKRGSGGNGGKAGTSGIVAC